MSFNNHCATCGLIAAVKGDMSNFQIFIDTKPVPIFFHYRTSEIPGYGSAVHDGWEAIKVLVRIFTSNPLPIPCTHIQLGNGLIEYPIYHVLLEFTNPTI